jgi:hypothetical protein
MLRSICVFCGSSSGAQSVYAQTAQEMGRLLARSGIGLVFGGSKLGLMGVLADACLSQRGQVRRRNTKDAGRQRNCSHWLD